MCDKRTHGQTYARTERRKKFFFCENLVFRYRGPHTNRDISRKYKISEIDISVRSRMESMESMPFAREEEGDSELEQAAEANPRSRQDGEEPGLLRQRRRYRSTAGHRDTPGTAGHRDTPGTTVYRLDATVPVVAFRRHASVPGATLVNVFAEKEGVAAVVDEDEEGGGEERPDGHARGQTHFPDSKSAAKNGDGNGADN